MPMNPSTGIRDQHLSLQWFRNRAEAKVSIEEWRQPSTWSEIPSTLKSTTLLTGGPPINCDTNHQSQTNVRGRPAIPARADESRSGTGSSSKAGLSG